LEVVPWRKTAYAFLVPDEMETINKELEAAKAEIQKLELELSNATLLLRQEMIATGKLPRVTKTVGLSN
jgi:hypothetical protein